MTRDALLEVFDSPLFRRNYVSSEHPENPAALPAEALEFLTELAGRLNAVNVFEFGSGQSTAAFLPAGLLVTSLEDSAHWMGETVARLEDEQKARHTALVRPLSVQMHGAYPVRDWTIDAEIRAKLARADLILVDSPYYVPFRESTLWSGLVENNHAVVVLDDARIRTVARFCDHLAAANPALLHRRVGVGHTFDVFGRPEGVIATRRGHGFIDVLKGWRRFFVAGKSTTAS